ncbi:neural-cadherin-like isoform X4 [Varroa destructor]|uniref:Neural-cadherin n=1 Tax=Varroa destructor TaxID=109461 RepID=A0A7M7M452_VARDE|nr:neural-cadherin-like isoform X4 [Varroa destructor]
MSSASLNWDSDPWSRLSPPEAFSKYDAAQVTTGPGPSATAANEISGNDSSKNRIGQWSRHHCHRSTAVVERSSPLQPLKCRRAYDVYSYHHYRQESSLPPSTALPWKHSRRNKPHTRYSSKSSGSIHHRTAAAVAITSLLECRPLRCLGKTLLAAILLVSVVDRSHAKNAGLQGPADWRPEHIVVTDNAYPGYILRQLNYYGPAYQVMQGQPTTQTNIDPQQGFLSESNMFALSDGGHLMKAPSSLPVVIAENYNGSFSPIYQAIVHVVPHKHRLTFISDGYQGSVPENLDSGATVSDLCRNNLINGYVTNTDIVQRELSSSSNDLMLQVNKPARFTIQSGNHDGLFKVSQIDPKTAVVITSAPLDREKQSKYDLVVKALSGPEEATRKLSIHVLDENDNSPEPVQDNYEFRVHADSVPQTVFGQIEGRDADGDSVVFKLVDRHPMIAVVPKTGELMLTRKPQDEWEREAELKSLVKEKTVGEKFDENLKKVQSVVKGASQRVRELGEEAGKEMRVLTLKLAARLHDNRKESKRYSPLVPITVHVIPPEKDSKKTTEADGKVDDLEKALEQLSEARHRSRRSIVNAGLGSIRPTKSYKFKENDGKDANKTVFTLDKKITGESFELEAANRWVTILANGEVKVKEKWDYEQLDKEKTIDFWVLVRIPGRAEKERQRIIIHITDVNDEPPYFINRPLPMQAVVQLNAPPGTPVFKLQARDPDSDHNIRYSIVRDRSGQRFEVDALSGEIITVGTAPFMLDKEYVLYVKAEDLSGPVGERQYQSTKEERLSIVGGKRPPQFYVPQYEATIPESQKKDSDIIEVKAKSFADREIRYTLRAQGKGAGTFNIGPTSGIVKLAKELDYEDLRQPKSYSLVVTATEDSGGFSTSVELVIKVTDVNDNAPRFELPDYQAHNIDEDVSVGTSILQVKATDMDTGRNAEITYSLDKEDFTIDSKGNIYSNKRLDADVNNTYVLTVKATDRGEPPLTGTATVRIYTENKNDEAPKFSQDVYTPNVDENAGPGTLVTTVVASDKDGDNVLFGFVNSGTTSGMFQIEERTGVIRLIDTGKINLDRDKYELNVTARDDGACCKNGALTPHTSTALVVVFITDVNDNKPVFEDCGSYAPKVEEGAQSGTSVIRVRAKDNDKGHNGQVRYSMVQQPNQKGTKFSVDEVTGEIRTNKVFDREGDDGRFVSVTVKATDRGSPPLEGVCSFKVEITDVNDNPPLFDRQEYRENVKQDTQIGNPILRVSASDEDADLNGVIIYNLTAPYDPTDLNYFNINPESGWIQLKKPLDRDSYHLRAIATDKGTPQHSATVEVVIDVVDRANNPPIWDQPVYGPIFIKENLEVGSKVISIKARSGIPDNPDVFYTLMKGSTEQTNKKDTFYLNQRNDGGHTWAELFVNYPLDYEKIQQYNLTIRVENNGIQQLASEATVYIVLEDVNDEIPLFIEREQETVLEGMPPGTKVTQVQAVDKDGTYPNNKVYYAIESKDQGDKYFTIDRETGDIYTKVEFDREEKLAYAIQVRAEDGAPSARPHIRGNSPNSVTKYIRIGIGDKNDNPPYFSQGLYEAEVNEDEDVQHTVITVTAKDKDESSRIRYEITQGNIGGAFAVKNETGAIYVAGPLDYETRKEYRLRLVASDNLNENHTTVLIRVKDVNDNAPIFDRPTYEAQITEENDRNLPQKILTYNLTLTASDTLSENNATVHIKIKDINDLPPKFERGSYEATIPEEDDRGLPKKILQVTATDGDRDRESDIVYFLTGQGVDNTDAENNKFAINQTTGEIYVLKPLDRDLPQGRSQWRFTVFAEDEGGNGLVGFADVLVNLKDINDNAPFFPAAVYTGNVTENGTAGMTVMTMTATDYDDPMEGANAKLTYSIEQNQVNENGELIFAIDEETGVISTAVCCLDRETNPEYTIKVVAVDGGGLKGTGTATIKIKDINDMPPEFTKKEWYVEVDETEADNIPEAPILVVSVNDGDLLETNRFSYKVIDSSFGADRFTMVTNSDGTGSLKIAKPLDFEDLQQRYGFNVTIQVSDNGGESADPYHLDYAKVRVRLRDINDNRPEFEKPNIEVSVPENSTIGSSLATFRATDADQGGKSKVSYQIDRSSDKRRQFTISSSGVVKIQRPLDREETPRHQVKILAIDDGTPARTATATLTVVVSDINDNPPRFQYDYRPVIPERAPPMKVQEILATDDDDRSKNNGPPFTFRMDPNAPDYIKELFRVEHDPTGANGDGMAVVHSKEQFDREVQKEYLVPILIKDSGSPSLTGTSTLTVIIGDSNDNRMHPGSKNIFVYNFKGENPPTKIGRVHVEDLDDWDLPDKTFFWENNKEHENFELDTDTGMITMKNVTGGGVYELKFLVYDRMHTQEATANVTVTVKEIPEEAIHNSGSIRIAGITDEDFIRVWDWKQQKQVKSKMEEFRDIISELVKTKSENVDIFSVILKQARPPITDVRFAAHGSPYYKASMLNGLVALNRQLIERKVGVNITQVGIDECLYENVNCEGSCSNELIVEKNPVMVNANRTSFVGVNAFVRAVCECLARDYSAESQRERTCRSKPYPCFNGGRCFDTHTGIQCKCPPGFYGPQCQQTTRFFNGKGFAWFPPLQQCESSHLSLEFMTTSENGLVLYNGPIAMPDSDELIVQDFVSLELVEGKPRLLLDFGSGTVELTVTPEDKIVDGRWQRIDLYWDRQTARITLNHCMQSRYLDANGGDRSRCENVTTLDNPIPPFNEFLNVNSPLQLGGVHVTKELSQAYDWAYRPNMVEGFNGCIKNVVHNSEMYDLASPGSSFNSVPGCPPAETTCAESGHAHNCGHGHCEGSYRGAECICEPGYYGPNCDRETSSKMFQQSSYIKYALSFDPHPFRTDVQMQFRTRQKNGELLRLSSKHGREYAILEIRDKKLRFRFNLDRHRNTDEKELWLPYVSVNDGQWHTVKVLRFGAIASIALDGGWGKRFNELLDFNSPHQLLAVEKQQVLAGGDVQYVGPGVTVVDNDFQEGCMNDIRIDGRSLPMESGSESAAVLEFRNLIDGCPSNNPCHGISCPRPFICVDLWMLHECRCSPGFAITEDGKNCTDLDECLAEPCLNGGTCVNRRNGEGFYCLCPDGFGGELCGALRQEKIMRLSMAALAAILVCLLNILILVLVIVAYTRSRRPDQKFGGGPCEDDIRENIISYDDEGGGEDDMNAYDITPLRIPIEPNGHMAGMNGMNGLNGLNGGMLMQPGLMHNGTLKKLGGPKAGLLAPLKEGPLSDVCDFISEHLDKVDNDPNAPPFDDVRTYAYEGSGSTAGSLSSLNSTGTDDQEQDFDYLNGWGPRFQKLADIYAQQNGPPDGKDH